MENECLLSIIIPAYNAKDTIARAVSSVSVESSSAVEVIVIDDASTDGTVSQLNRLTYQHTRLLMQAKNCGQGVARNLGIANANGKFICFLDADDWVSENFVSKIIKAINCNHDIDLFLFGFRRIERDNVSQHECKFRVVAELLSDFVLDKIPCTTWAKVYRRELIEAHAIKFLEMIPGEDIVFNAKFLRHTKKIHVIPDIYYNYDCRQASTTRSIYSLSVIQAHEKADDVIRSELSHLVEHFEKKSFARSYRYLFMHSMSRMANDQKLGRLRKSLKRDIEYFLKQRFRLLKVLMAVYLTGKEKFIFALFIFCKPLAYLAFRFNTR